MCKTLRLHDDLEAALWRTCDARGTGSVDLKRFIKCHELWARKVKQGGEATRKNADARASAAKAAQYLKETAYRKKWTMHELFEAIDFDHDGWVTTEDLYAFSVNPALNGRDTRGVRSQVAVSDFSNGLQVRRHVSIYCVRGNIVSDYFCVSIQYSDYFCVSIQYSNYFCVSIHYA